MKFINLDRQYTKIKPKLQKSISRVLETSAFIQGNEVKILEDRLSNYVGSKYCTTCANGTDALQLALMALEVGSGDEVIIPGFNYIAASEVITLLGARPIHVDICLTDFNIDPKDITSKITSRTKAVIATSLFGVPADFTEIRKQINDENLVLIEDAAQSFGSRSGTQKSCNMADISTTSFFPTKPLGCYGDGGAVFTNDPILAQKLNKISKHGQKKKYLHDVIGVNSRLDTLQAAILLEKLPLLDEEIKYRQANANKYTEAFKKLPIITPTVPITKQSAWAQYTVILEDRDDFSRYLTENGIPFAVHYPLPVYRQPAYFMREVSLENAQYAADHVLSLPIDAYMTNSELNKIIRHVNNYFH